MNKLQSEEALALQWDKLLQIRTTAAEKVA